MSDRLEIEDTGTLDDLRGALERFAAQMQQALRAVQEQIRQTQAWLDDRVDHWQREVERARRAVQGARAALRSCESSGYLGHGRHNCGAERAALARAEAELRAGQQCLQEAQVWRSKVAQAVSSYEREARRLERVAGDHTAEARAELAGLRERYEAVARAQVATGISGARDGAITGDVATLSDVSSVPEVGIKDMHSDTAYQRGAYEFATDEHGRTKSVSATLELDQGSRSGVQAQVGKLGRSTDEGGHLIGARFNGPTDAFNLVPQDANLNRSAWETMENGWARALSDGHRVQVLIAPLYRGGSVRPWAFQVVAQVDLGNLVYHFFRNKPT